MVDGEDLHRCLFLHGGRENVLDGAGSSSVDRSECGAEPVFETLYETRVMMWRVGRRLPRFREECTFQLGGCVHDSPVGFFSTDSQVHLGFVSLFKKRPTDTKLACENSRGPLTLLNFSVEGNWLAKLHENGESNEVVVWEMEECVEVARIPVPPFTWATKISPSGMHLITIESTDSEGISLQRIEDGQFHAKLTGELAPATFSDDGSDCLL